MTYASAAETARHRVTDHIDAAEAMRDGLELVLAGWHARAAARVYSLAWDLLGIAADEVAGEFHYLDPVIVTVDPDDHVAWAPTVELVTAIAGRLDDMASHQPSGSDRAWRWATHAARLRHALEAAP